MVEKHEDDISEIFHSVKIQKKKKLDDKECIRSELDEPKYKIENPELFAKSREVIGNLITKMMVTSGGTDVDWLIEHNNGFMIFEFKIFHSDLFIISKAQMLAYEKLHDSLDKCRILFVGHDDLDFKNLWDHLWFFEMKHWKSGDPAFVSIQNAERAYNDNETQNYYIPRRIMEEIDVKHLQDMIDSIWKKFESR
jgi:hypothetical protein